MTEIDQESFVLNRTRLFELLPDKSAVLLLAARPSIRSGDTNYPYSQDRNFYYFTGYDNRQAAVLMQKTGKQTSTQMFVIQLTDLQIHWTGYLPGPKEVEQLTGISPVHSIDNLPDILTRTLSDVETLYLDFHPLSIRDPLTPIHQLAEKIRLANPHLEIRRASSFIAKLREIKSAGEIDRLQTAVNLTHSGLNSMLSNLKPGIREFELEAWFNLALHLRQSCPAFPTIVAAGKNATILHYNSLDTTITDDELILFDLGAEFGHYSADISRTFPVSGRFTPEQKKLYDLVVEANIETISAVSPGLPIAKLNEITKNILANGMKQLGYITDNKEISRYYTHGVSHPLGLDTHDVHSAAFSTLQPGMVITIEPGLYLPEQQIGIRIEDDIVVTENGCINLSESIPKKADEVETWIADAQSSIIKS